MSVAIIYETAADGMRAKRFSDQVAAEVDAGDGLNININVWSFRILKNMEMRCLAACAAAAADIIIISTTGAKRLPEQVKNWIRMWSGILDGRNPHVVALFARPVRENAPIRSALRRSVMQGGIDCFTHTERGVVGMRCCHTNEPDASHAFLGGKRSTAGNARSAVVIGKPEQSGNPARRAIFDCSTH